MGPGLPPQLASIEKEARDIFKLLTTGFQKLDIVKDVDKQNKQLEDLTAKMREAKRLIKEFDKETKEAESTISSESVKTLNEKKQALIKELNSFVALRKTYTSSIGNREEHLDGGLHARSARGSTQMDSQPMDEATKTREKSSKVLEHNIHIGTETATTSEDRIGQTVEEQPSKPNDQVGTTRFSMKDASFKEIVRKMATNRCIMVVALIILVAIIVIVIMTLVHPEGEVTRSTPPPRRRRLLMTAMDFQC
ncbi:novel plant SNARE 13 [Physcomitrium patens]|uniref:Uncharacterized protein n=1 Tax=Physcomitrium patens TaxID=3218 RepID=A9SL82_PHYPA|nr:novel plant SNARE 13-like [Physcomitrium patens]XP_024384041.1 novel plant SNARE 13-like [Physcomitrium patens]XP_024384042.1 novel plant SNARE 13-like [Physcomitrium patens]PNR47626.1 hypothetical protein PHYPA_012099 [Physcomitrium patens]|eukprot:XP_024384040.1 novel plant SNARE 13-like [Physcomitrella patens]